MTMTRDQELGVTVVIPTLNRGGYLRETLADLVSQQHRPLEILVVDQSTTTDPVTEELYRRWEGLVVHHRVPFRGLPQARNYGWQHARYEAVVFVDDDIRCGPDLVSEHLKGLMRPGVGIVAGAIDTPGKSQHSEGHTGRFSSWTAAPLRGFDASGEFEVDHGPGGNFSAWREVLRMAGGFDERLSVGAALYEETDLCLRVRKLGYRIWFNGRARVLHLAAPFGGCRVETVADYVWALAHNRSALIRRHVGVVKRPVALAELARLAFAYAWHYRAPRALVRAATGVVRGWKVGGLPPRCCSIG